MKTTMRSINLAWKKLMAVTPCLGTAGAWMWCTTTGVALAEAYRHGRGCRVGVGSRKKNMFIEVTTIWNHENHIKSLYKIYCSLRSLFESAYKIINTMPFFFKQFIFFNFVPSLSTQMTVGMRRVNSCYLWRGHFAGHAYN